MTTSSGFVKADALVFEQLAAFAPQDLSGLEGKLFGLGWSVLRLLQPVQFSGFAPGQGYYASGSLQDGTEVAVLALGIDWLGLCNVFTASDHLLAPVQQDILGEEGLSVNFEGGYLSSYSTMRGTIWSNLTLIGSKPLYVLGKGPGAPLAQLAALDLRPGKKGPSDENPPSAVPVCYTYSPTRSAGGGFKSYYDSKVPQTYNVWAGTQSLPIDFFPEEPGEDLSGDPFVLPGQLESQATAIPIFVVPWLTRSDQAYFKLLGGEPVPGSPTAGSIPSPPAGFVQPLAFTLAQLCAVAYQQRQHPENPLQFSIQPYTVGKSLTSNGVVYCTIFQSASPANVVVAFRGAVTWAETATLLLNSLPENANFLGFDHTEVHAGALQVYTAGVDHSDDPLGRGTGTPLREELATELKTLVKSGTSLYLTGHGFGGCLASLAAIDLKVNQKTIGLDLTQLYTFGTPSFGTPSFMTNTYQPHLGSDSYQLFRPGDFMPRVNFVSLASPQPQVRLNGTPADDDDTEHMLTTYIDLLNPNT